MDYFNRLSMLPISTDSSESAKRRDIIIALTRQHELTAYDATYLDLALRYDAQLATFDTQLANAMRRAGGKVFGNEGLGF
jgi:predicted nucleic acid-binding protein